MEAAAAIRAIELDEMLRGLSYHDTGPGQDLSAFREVIETFRETAHTPSRCEYDKVISEDIRYLAPVANYRRDFKDKENYFS